MPIVCPVCNAENRARAKSCWRCGADLTGVAKYLGTPPAMDFEREVISPPPPIQPGAKPQPSPPPVPPLPEAQDQTAEPAEPAEPLSSVPPELRPFPPLTWDQVPLHRRWWFVLLATVVLLPIGLIMMWRGEVYRRYRNEVVIVPWKEKAQVTFVLLLLIGLNLVRYMMR